MRPVVFGGGGTSTTKRTNANNNNNNNNGHNVSGIGLGDSRIADMDHIVTYHLDYAKLGELQYMVETTSAIQECIDLIRFTLFQNINWDNNPPIKEFKNLFNDYYVPFFEETLRASIAAGFVVVSTRRQPYRYSAEDDIIEDSSAGKKRSRTIDSHADVPVVVPFEHLSIKLHYDTITNDVIFDVKRNREEVGLASSSSTRSTTTTNAPDHKRHKQATQSQHQHAQLAPSPPLKVIMFTSIGCLVRQGIVHSICSGLLDQFRYIKQLERYYLQSESTRSNPAFVLQPSPGDSGGAPGSSEYNQATFAYDFVNSSTGGVAGITDAQKVRALQFGTAHMSLFSNFRHHQDEIAQRSSAGAERIYEVDSSCPPQWYNNSFVVPPGMQMGATPQMPSTSVDVHMNRMAFAEQVRSKFGFPDAIFRLSSVGGRFQKQQQQQSSNQPQQGTLTPIDINRFDTVMKVYRDFFEKLYRFSYQLCWQRDPPGDIIFDEPPVLKSFINEIKEEAAAKRTSTALDLEHKRISILQAKKDLATKNTK